MASKIITKEIDIDAPRDTVWQVLTDNAFTNKWYQEFSEGTHVVTDWTVGSKAVFKDKTGDGIIGKILTNKPGEELSLEYTGMLQNNVEDYESEQARQVMGFREVYKLSEIERGTHLDVSSDMGEDHYDTMSSAWEKAMKVIKSLAEKA